MKRKEAQSRINEMFMNGEINREEWSRRFDELSSPRWNADGPVKAMDAAAIKEPSTPPILKPLL